MSTRGGEAASGESTVEAKVRPYAECTTVLCIIRYDTITVLDCMQARPTGAGLSCHYSAAPASAAAAAAAAHQARQQSQDGRGKTAGA